MNSNPRDCKGRIHSIESFGAVDGPGVRFVVFFQGCPLRCQYCHNPDSWSFADGEEKTAGELIDQIADYRSFIAKGGVTLSGGEPLAQPEFCLALLKVCRDEGFHTAVDTSGALPLAATRNCIDAADLLLLDLKDLDQEDCRRLTGQSNELTIKTLDYCEQSGKPVWVRHVCLPGVTLLPEKLERLAQFLSHYRCVKRVELIPFHQMGSYKWDFVDAEYQLASVLPPTAEQMEQAKEIFRNYQRDVI